MLWPFRFPPCCSTKHFLPWHLSTSPQQQDSLPLADTILNGLHHNYLRAV
jgi:hypothetical protein